MGNQSARNIDLKSCLQREGARSSYSWNSGGVMPVHAHSNSKYIPRSGGVRLVEYYLGVNVNAYVVKTNP